MAWRGVVVVVAAVAWSSTHLVSAQQMPAERLDPAEVEQRLGAALPKNAEFLDHRGRRVRLGDLFDGRRPVVLSFAYYTCPVICSLVLDAEAAALSGIPWTLGKEYQAITISIDPRDTPQRAAAKRTQLLRRYGRPVKNEGWTFLVGQEAAIRAAAGAAGFGYFYDTRQKQYGHAAVLIAASPRGEMARYFFGMRFPSSDLRLALLEASQGRFASIAEKVMLYCYSYDVDRSTYVLVALRVMRLGGLLIALILAVALAMLWRWDYRRAKP